MQLYNIKFNITNIIDKNYKLFYIYNKLKINFALLYNKL